MASNEWEITTPDGTPIDAPQEPAGVSTAQGEAPIYDPNMEMDVAHIQEEDWSKPTFDDAMPTRGEAFWGGGVGSQLLGIYQLIEKTAGSVNPERQKKALADIAETQEMLNVMPEERRNWMLGGEIAPWLAPGAASVPKAVMGATEYAVPTLMRQSFYGAGEGALAGAAQPVDPNSPYFTTKGQQIGLGLLGGGATPSAVRGVGKGVKGGYRSVRPVVDRMLDPKVKQAYNSFLRVASGRIDPDMLAHEINPHLKDAGIAWQTLPKKTQRKVSLMAKEQYRTGNFDPDALARKAIAESVGFTGDAVPTAGQLTRDPLLFTEEAELAKRTGLGPESINKRIAQGKVFQRWGEELQDSLGDFSSDIDTSNHIFSALKNVDKESGKTVSELYDASMRQVDPDRAEGITMTATMNRLAGLADDIDINAYADAGFGAPTNYVKSYLKGGKELLPEHMELVRRGLSDMTVNAPTPTEKYIAGRLLQALESDGIDAFGDDMYKAARDAAINRYSQREAVVIQKALGLKGAPLREDRLMDAHIIKGEPKQIRKMIDMLTDPTAQMDPRARANAVAEGEQVLGKIRGGVWDHLVFGTSESNSALKVDIGGAVKFNGTQFRNRWLKLKKGGQAAEIFTEEQIAMIDRFSTMGEMLTVDPLYSSVNYSNTASKLINELDRRQGGLTRAAIMAIPDDKAKNYLRAILAGHYKFQPREDYFTKGMDVLFPEVARTARVPVGAKSYDVTRSGMEAVQGMIAEEDE